MKKKKKRYAGELDRGETMMTVVGSIFLMGAIVVSTLVYLPWKVVSYFLGHK